MTDREWMAVVDNISLAIDMELARPDGACQLVLTETGADLIEFLAALGGLTSQAAGALGGEVVGEGYRAQVDELVQRLDQVLHDKRYHYSVAVMALGCLVVTLMRDLRVLFDTRERKSMSDRTSPAIKEQIEALLRGQEGE